MNSSSYLTLHHNSISPQVGEAGERVTRHLKNVKHRLALAEEKIELSRNYISRSQMFISHSKKHFETENEIINKCMERLKLLEITLKDSHVVKKHLLFRGKTPASASENKLLQGALNTLSSEVKSVISHQPGRYEDIDLNNQPEAAFWCKRFNVSPRELLNAMQKIKSKCWIDVWKYFLVKNEPVTLNTVVNNKNI